MKNDLWMEFFPHRNYSIWIKCKERVFLIFSKDFNQAVFQQVFSSFQRFLSNNFPPQSLKGAKKRRENGWKTKYYYYFKNCILIYWKIGQIKSRSSATDCAASRCNGYPLQSTAELFIPYKDTDIIVIKLGINIFCYW